MTNEDKDRIREAAHQYADKHKAGYSIHANLGSELGYNDGVRGVLTIMELKLASVLPFGKVQSLTSEIIADLADSIQESQVVSNQVCDEVK